MRSRALATLVDEFKGDAELVDGTTLTINDLPDLLMATTLFSDTRLVVIKDLSENTAVWNELPTWLERVADGVDVVFVETKPDRRTQTFKELKKAAIIKEFAVWGSKDLSEASGWLVNEADQLGVKLDKRQATTIVERVGFDQHRLISSLEKLALVGQPVTVQLIEDITDIDPSANVFSLFEIALSGDSAKLRYTIDTLKLVEEPYKVFGLLNSQLFQLSAVVIAGPDDAATTDFGIHPYVASKLGRAKKTLTRQKLQKIVTAFADADLAMKTSSIDPWLLIEQALMTTANEIAS